MKLTPLEIKKQQFEKSLRGYDVAEVKSFLSLVSNEVEQLLNRNKEQEEEIQKLTDRVKHYERVEEALHETLQTTKDSATQKIEQAKAEAQNKIAKAELTAESIIQEANRYRQDVRREILRMLDKREEIIAGISSYLENAKLVLAQFEKDDLKTYTLEKPEIIKPEPVLKAEETIADAFELEPTPIEEAVADEAAEGTEEETTIGQLAARSQHDDDDNIDDIIEELE